MNTILNSKYPEPTYFDHHLNLLNDKAQIREILSFIRECQVIDPNNPNLFRAEWRALLQLDLRERVIKYILSHISALSQEAWVWALLGEALMESEADLAVGCLARSLLLTPGVPGWLHTQTLLLSLCPELETPLTQEILTEFAEFSMEICPLDI